MTQGVVSGPTCKKRKTAGQTTQLTFQGCIDATAVDVTFFSHPAATFTPRRCTFIPVFALGSNGSDSDGGVDRFDAWLNNGLNDEVV